jgi:hypothetical protein
VTLNALQTGAAQKAAHRWRKTGRSTRTPAMAGSRKERGKHL